MKKTFVIVILIITFICIVCIAHTSILTHKLIASQENGKDEEKVEETKATDVEFVGTYMVVANLNKTDATGEYDFYVVEKFQEFEPLVIKVNKQYKLTENVNYEFTFNGKKTEGKDYTTRDIFDTFTISKIEKTNKVGLDQRQDSI